jgi:hypothetical protein
VKLFIPWRFFFRCLRKQQANSREYWLTYFSFDDPGVTLIPDVPITPEDIRRESPLRSREKQERAVLSRLVQRKRRRTLH